MLARAISVATHLRQSVDEFPILPVGLSIKLSEQIQNVRVHLDQGSLQCGLVRALLYNV